MEKSPTTKLQAISAFGKNIGNSVQHFFVDTYNEKKEELAEGLSLFKDEVSGSISKAGNYINHLILPINNFLKDGSQIEKEFEDELKKNEEYCICLDGKMIPASEVLARPMEENY